MKFSIITPTHKRRELLDRCVASVLSQTYTDWELIIVNDSPYDEKYDSFAPSINDPRISYYKNDSNRGKNYSSNFALDKVSSDSKWIIFLDDDDFFSPDTLYNFYQLIVNHPDNKWFVTNRARKNGVSFTQFPRDEATYSYAWSYLILKRCKGDATHCIETKLITHINARFSRYVKQGEEWFFFYQIGLHSKMYYYDHNSTISDGYDAEGGLNFRKRTFSERYEALVQLGYEASVGKIIRPSIVIYLLARCLSLFFKK